MRDYLEGYRFTVITDHQSLRWLQRLESPSGRLGRWLFELQQFDFEIRYRKGSLNQVADALSRQPEVCATKRTKSCPWYRRITTGLRTRPVDSPGISSMTSTSEKCPRRTSGRDASRHTSDQPCSSDYTT